MAKRLRKMPAFGFFCFFGVLPDASLRFSRMSHT
jgi:hypothetical protein